MKIIKNDKNVKCAMSGCRRRAEYAVAADKALAGNYIYVCNECMRDMYCEIGKIIVPKSPRSPFGKDAEKRGTRL